MIDHQYAPQIYSIFDIKKVGEINSPINIILKIVAKTFQ
jgi:hypothetical protein